MCTGLLPHEGELVLGDPRRLLDGHQSRCGNAEPDQGGLRLALYVQAAHTHLEQRGHGRGIRWVEMMTRGPTPA